MARIIYIVHTGYGRTRLRLPWLRGKRDEATSLADALGGIEGMESVEIRPFTGSVLCLHDPLQLSPDRIVETVRAHSGVKLVIRPGETPPPEVEVELRRALSQGSGVARATTRFFKELNVDVLRSTEGRLDLGTLTAMGFVGAGLLEVAVTRKLPVPPWFNLGWWALRTFTTFEGHAMAATEPEGAPPPEEPAPEPAQT